VRFVVLTAFKMSCCYFGLWRRLDSEVAWKKTQRVSPKCWYLLTGPHSITTQKDIDIHANIWFSFKAVHFIVLVMSNLLPVLWLISVSVLFIVDWLNNFLQPWMCRVRSDLLRFIIHPKSSEQNGARANEHTKEGCNVFSQSVTLERVHEPVRFTLCFGVHFAIHFTLFNPFYSILSFACILLSGITVVYFRLISLSFYGRPEWWSAVIYNVVLIWNGSRGSSVSIVSDYGLDHWAMEIRFPAQAKWFFLHPLSRPLWGPPSLLSNW
jgi:hypothetical protein